MRHRDGARISRLRNVWAATAGNRPQPAARSPVGTKGCSQGREPLDLRARAPSPSPGRGDRKVSRRGGRGQWQKSCDANVWRDRAAITISCRPAGADDRCGVMGSRGSRRLTPLAKSCRRYAANAYQLRRLEFSECLASRPADPAWFPVRSPESRAGLPAKDGRSRSFGLRPRELAAAGRKRTV